jgi:2-keto-4-pentenoate hydratase
MSGATTSEITSAELTRLGEALLHAFENGVSIEPLTDARPTLSVDAAYGVQRALLSGHAACGRRVAGRKIGLTSLAIQQQLGIDSPDFGAILDSHAWSNGVSLSRAGLRMIAPKLEPEIAFVLDRPLSGPGVGISEVLSATGAVLPVFEVIDSRIRDWRIGLADTVADNASCFGAVLGAGVPLAAVGPLPELNVTFSRDGVMVERGAGAAVMGDPAAAVAWLANELARFGESLPAGEPVLSGSMTAAVDATPGRYDADFGERLGTVAVEITD